MGSKRIATVREMVMAALVLIFMVYMFGKSLYSPKSQELEIVSKQAKELKTKKVTINKEVEALRLKQSQKQHLAIPGQKSDNPKVQILKGESKPEYGDLTDLVHYITMLGSSLGLTIDTLSSRPPESREGYNRVQILFKAHGSFASLTEFIRKLDSVKALFILDSIALTSEAAVSGEMILDVKSTLFEVEGIDAQ